MACQEIEGGGEDTLAGWGILPPTQSCAQVLWSSYCGNVLFDRELSKQFYCGQRLFFFSSIQAEKIYVVKLVLVMYEYMYEYYTVDFEWAVSVHKIVIVIERIFLL